MSRKVINVVKGGNSQFTKVDLSPINSKIEQLIQSETVTEINLTEEEVLLMYGVENLRMINNLSFVLLSIYQNIENTNTIAASNFIANKALFYESSNIDSEQPVSYYRVYNIIYFSIDDVNFELDISILKDGVELDGFSSSFIIGKI